ncbi:hypothetical protein FXO38_03246 [Capsicum annuum]|uniref:Uncharacterized protein n=1 Tax=Capsicum annuum TaxID=4072 RepID=A0A2G2Z299_CAPAN|nr:hypothetical protein FXO38_03246 [Capsicum annuum]PHT76074.1 hypothetical protein T459_19596 [Capsicum annuum]
MSALIFLSHPSFSSHNLALYYSLFIYHRSSHLGSLDLGLRNPPTIDLDNFLPLLVLTRHKQSLDVATISEGQSQFFSLLMLAWGGIVDIDIEYEKHRWMGRDLIDFYGMKRTFWLRRYNSCIKFVVAPDGYFDLVVIKGVPKVNIAMVDGRVKQRRPCKITTRLLLQGAFSHQYMLDPINIIARVRELSKQQKREQPGVPDGFINFSKFPALSSTFDILWHHLFELLLGCSVMRSV